MEVHHDQAPDTHHVGRRPVRRQSEYDHGRAARARAARGLSADRKACPPEPRANPRTHRPRQGYGRARHIHGHSRHHQIYKGEDLLRGREEDRDARALFHRCWRARRCRRRARRARLCAEILHRGRQLGHGRQQHADLLRPRLLQIPGFHPYAEAPPAHQHALADGNVGLLVTVAREPAPGHDLDERPWLAAEPAFYERLRLAHLFIHQRAERAGLGQNSISRLNKVTNSIPTARPRRSSARTASRSKPICSAPSNKATSPNGSCLSRSCRKPRSASTGTTRST